jgi:hypothetical protein
VGRLRRQRDDSVRSAVSVSVVVGATATSNHVPPGSIVREARSNLVNLELDHVSEQHYFLRPRGTSLRFGCDLHYGIVTEELCLDLPDLEDLRGEATPIALGTPCIGVSGQVHLHEVNLFVLMTALRVLGRTTRATLVDLGRGVIMDDWLSWSLDYMEQDMFKVRRVDDPGSPDFTRLADEFPHLRRKRFLFF